MHFEHPNRSNLIVELGYSEKELLDPSQARGYRFDTSPDGIVIKEMEKTPQGFIDPAMNQTIEELTKIAIRLDEAEAEN
jgi:hypothetical protein